MSGPDTKVLDTLKGMLRAVGREMTEASHIDDVFWQVQALIRSNEAINIRDVFQGWIGTTYVDSMMVRLRRMVDRRSDTISLYRVLEEMKAPAPSFTRTWFVAQWSDPMKSIGEDRFDSIAGKGAACLSADTVTTKQEELNDAFRRVKKYANKRITHMDPKVVPGSVTYADVRESLVDAFIVYNWCDLIVTCKTYVTPVPAIQSPWFKAFQVPWLPHGDPLPEYKHLDDLIKTRRANGLP